MIDPQYKPYGPEWAKEVTKMPKAALIAMLVAASKERDRLRAENEWLAARQGRDQRRTISVSETVDGWRPISTAPKDSDPAG